MKALPAFLASFVATLSLIGCGSQPSSTLGVVTPQVYSFGTYVLNASSAMTPNRTVVQLTNTTTTPVDFELSVSGSAAFALEPSLSCAGTAAMLAPGSGCLAVVAFRPTAAGPYQGQLAISSSASSAFSRSVALSGTAATLTPGQSLVQVTDNPQVVLYSWYPPAAGNVAVSYSSAGGGTHRTGSVLATGAAPVSIYVAGLLQSTAYSLAAQLTPVSGAVVSDMAHAVTTTAWPAGYAPQVATVTTAGQTPSPGLELMNETDVNTPNSLPIYAIDLNGNLVWAYNMRDFDAKTTIVQSPRQLPNGDFVFLQGPASQDVLKPGSYTVNDLREIDLAGNIVRHLTVASLNTALASAGYANLNVQTLHHEVLVLPNGHTLVFGNILKSVASLAGYSSPVNVLGDVVIDLDQNWTPVWTWNTFDHLDPNYHPAAAAFPDWTHCNALQYEPEDGNLILSCRHLSWVIKINYADGKGTGAVMWRMGNNGDFALTNGSTPLNWQYAQHSFHIISPATAGVFDATMIDNGDYRIDNTGAQVCQGTFGSGPNCFTTEPVYHVDENAKTVTVLWRNVLPAANFSFFGGAAQQLANQDLEFTLSTQPNNTSTTTEYTDTSSMTQVWQLTVTNQQSYRGGRITGLYPGVGW